MKKRYGDNIRVLFTETDSLMDEVCTRDFDHELWATREHLDLAGYPKTSPFYNGTNNKLVGKFMDEANGDLIDEFVGLKAKMYFHQTLNTGAGNNAFTREKWAKRLQRAAVAKLRHQELKAELDEPEENFIFNCGFGRKLHKIYGIKVGMSCNLNNIN